MPATAQHLLNQIADGRFPLRKLLGVSPNSAVFLTSAAPPRPRDPNFDAAIKLIPADPATSDLQLDHWRAAAALSHPGLLRIFYYGRCIIDGSPCLYIVTEIADEDLGQLLPRRALTPDETCGMLAAVLPTLNFLHENGLVHAGLKPSNIHATGDNVKLSADRILPAGESVSTTPLAAPFAAPESILFPAADIWSLGISLCETLTKNLPAQAASGRFALPELPAPFSEIVRSALVDDATMRITLDQVRSLLDPSFVAKRETVPATIPPADPATPASKDVAISDSNVAAVASPYVRPPDSPDSPESILAAAQADPARAAETSSRRTPRQAVPKIDPLAIPLSPVAANATPPASRSRIPVSSLPHVNATIGGPRRTSAPHLAPRSHTLFFVSAAAVVGLALLFGPRYFLRSHNSSAPNSPNSVATSSAPKRSADNATKTPPALNSITANSSPPSKSNAATNSPETSAKSSAPNSAPTSNGAKSTSRNSSAPAPAPTNSRSAAAPSSVKPAAPRSSNTNLAPVTVVHQVLPEVSARARSTIRGTVRINVRVRLNPDGSVSAAELNSPAASEFFANLALKAARQWKFAPPSPAASGPSASSAVLRFDFTPSSTIAYLP